MNIAQACASQSSIALLEIRDLQISTIAHGEWIHGWSCIQNISRLQTRQVPRRPPGWSSPNERRGRSFLEMAKWMSCISHTSNRFTGHLSSSIMIRLMIYHHLSLLYWSMSYISRWYIYRIYSIDRSTPKIYNNLIDISSSIKVFCHMLPCFLKKTSIHGQRRGSACSPSPGCTVGFQKKWKGPSHHKNIHKTHVIGFSKSLNIQ